MQRNVVFSIGLLLVQLSHLIQAPGICTSDSFFGNRNDEYENEYEYESNPEENYQHNETITCDGVDLNNFRSELTDINSQHNYTLIVVNSNMSTIPSLTFANFPLKLVGLELKSTYVMQILPGAFNTLNFLEELNLSDNNLTRISDGVFNSLINLRMLDLSRNSIQNISVNAFAGMGELHTIDLSHNILKTLNNDWLRYLVRLQSLDLSFSQLSMPNFNLTSNTLKYLNLSNNNLSNFTGSFTLLSSLDLSNNKLHSFKMDISKTCTNVLYLDLSSNFLSDLKSESFSVNCPLHLFLQKNNINSIPNGFFSHLNILFLNLSSNQLEYLQYGLFDSLHNLEVLDISHNKLNAFKIFNYHSLTNLKELYLHDNELSNLESLDIRIRIPHLHKISLDGNNFTCDNLMTFFRYIQFNKVVRRHYFNSSNINGIACTENANRYLNSTLLENSTTAGNLLLSKLNHFFNSGFTKTEMYKYFNEHFKNSNFFKYLEELKDDSSFKTSFMFKFFHEDFKNSSFYKYLENMKEERQTHDHSVKNYFENDFRNSSFVKYLNSLPKILKVVADGFSNSSMYNYLNNGFTNSSFYKYLESVKASQYVEKYSGNHSEIKAEKLINFHPEEKNNYVYVPILIIILLLLVCIVVFMSFLTYLVYSKFKNQNKIENQQMHLIEA